MAYTITHIGGSMEASPPLSALPDLIAELDDADDEHPDIAVSYEDGWTLSAYRDGHVIWGDVEEDDEWHLDGVDRARLLQLFEALARGDRAAVDAEPWIFGS